MKYYVIKRSNNGRLLDVCGFDTKSAANRFLNDLLERGYQPSIVLACVLKTAPNLEAERIKAGVSRV